MTFDRTHLPEPINYFSEQAELTLEGKGKWRTASCEFHGGRKTMRVNTETGAFRCMAECGAKGGDVLAYHMASKGMEFIEAAKALGAWTYDGKETRKRPTLIPARDMLEIAANEILIVVIVASDLAQGKEVCEPDRKRLLIAAGRLCRISDEVHHYVN